MKAVVALLALTLVLAGCSAASPEVLIANADCGDQTGMSGDLAADVVGMWRWSWTPRDDGDPRTMLLEFRADGSATTIAPEFGYEQWSYRVVDDEVWMSGADPGDDLQSLRTTWAFEGGAWNIVPGEIDGTSTLERCEPSA